MPMGNYQIHCSLQPPLTVFMLLGWQSIKMQSTKTPFGIAYAKTASPVKPKKLASSSF
jgi:hypothetical protein